MEPRHSFLPLCLVLFGALFATSPARAAIPPGDNRTVALLPLLGSGLGLDELSSVDAMIQREVDARYGARSLPAPVVRERLEAGAQRGLRCDRSSESCQAQLGIVLDTDLVLIAELTPAPFKAGVASGGFTLALHVVDVVDASQLALAQAAVPALPTSAEVKRLLARLDEPDARKALIVVTGPSGAPVVVDGAPRGSLPLPKPIEVAAGRHEVVVHTDPIVTESVAVRRGERVEVRASGAAPVIAATPTPPAPEPPADVVPVPATPAPEVPAEPPMPPRILAIAGGGGLVVLGAAAFVAGILPWYDTESKAARLGDLENQVLEDRSALEANKAEIETLYPEYLDAYGNWTSWGQVAVAAGVAAVIVGGTVVVVGALALE